MTVYVVQYHDNSWGAQESDDEILGVYSTEEKAEERACKFRDNGYSHPDDSLTVSEIELDEDIPSYTEYIENQCE